MWSCFRLLSCPGSPRLWPHPSPPAQPLRRGGGSGPLFLSGASLRAADEGDKAPQTIRSQASLACQSRRHHERRGSPSGHCHPPGRAAASLLLSAGDLGAQSLPRVAAAHHRPAGVRAHLPSPSELQRVLPAVPRHALGGRHLLSRRRGGTVRSGLPVRAPPLLPGLRALCAAEVRSGAGKGGRRAGRARPRPPAERGRDRAAGWRRVPLGARWAGSRWRRAVGSGWVRRPAPPPLSPTRRLAPLYASARALWLLVALAALGLLAHFLPAVLRATLLGQLRKLLLRA